MFEMSQLIVFMTAALILLVIPGPAVLYIVARSIHQGRFAGLVSVLGIGTGALFHIAAAVLGISALIASSAIAFSVVKYLGAAYLVYLGLKNLLADDQPSDAIGINEAPIEPLSKVFYQGVVVNVLNPKTALFFAAFLPQFADSSRGSVSVQILVLGVIFVVMAITSDSVYALLAGTFGDWLKRNRQYARLQRYFSGGVYLTLGLATAISGSKTK
jgi:threonine/homoserine/homoserine lactone efflux protein